MHTTTVVPPAVENEFGEGAYTLVCTCGERVTYSGRSFTMVEAQRHQSWHARQAREITPLVKMAGA